MSILQPNQHCRLNCAYHDDLMCVCNLVSVREEHTPITFGLRVGLNHIYGSEAVPPCVHGPLGESYWSTVADLPSVISPQ